MPINSARFDPRPEFLLYASGCLQSVFSRKHKANSLKRAFKTLQRVSFPTQTMSGFSDANAFNLLGDSEDVNEIAAKAKLAAAKAAAAPKPEGERIEQVLFGAFRGFELGFFLHSSTIASVMCF